MQNKYPLWKNIALILIAVLGLLYALPNLFGEDPAIQISSQNPVDNNQLMSQVKTVLTKAKLPYRSIKPLKAWLEIRFASTDIQLAAQDVLKNALGQNYTVALNLLPSTPAWLAKLGAEPMKQGLDLRGGIHMLIEVDVDSVTNRHYEGLMKSIGQDLREGSVRYSGIRLIPGKGVLLQFRTPELLASAKTVMANKPDYSRLNIEQVKNTNALTISMSEAELTTLRQNTMEQTMGILRNRVNELGVGEAIVQQQGATRIAVDLPGIQDAAKAKLILGGTATLQFYMVDDENDAVVAKQTGAIPLNTKLYMMNAYPILLKRQVVLSGDSITSAVSGVDEQNGSNIVNITLGGGGEAFFTKTTRENIGRRMAIVFVETKTRIETVNNVQKRVAERQERVISAPVINSALFNKFYITGMKDAKEASDLALLLRAGALPAVIYPIEERMVGPSLGKENIKRGIISLEVGMGLILFLMVIYYRFFGLVANIALFLNLILLAALLSLIGATLTLPGIAAFVLTVGMAVDANVLINERIREELRNGMSPQASIYAGYERAFSTIIDANVTTLIVGVVLFAIGTGPIRGFAVVLSLGLLTSMLTSITYTRAIVNWYYGGRTVKKLSIGI